MTALSISDLVEVYEFNSSQVAVIKTYIISLSAVFHRSGLEVSLYSNPDPAVGKTSLHCDVIKTKARCHYDVMIMTAVVRGHCLQTSRGREIEQQ